jgi:outer membrane protein assembly factor BamD (BamD/ComL family)
MVGGHDDLRAEVRAEETQPCTAAVVCLSTAIRIKVRRSVGDAHSTHLNLRATLEPETNTAVKPISKILHLIVLILLCNSLLLAADRGTLVREAILYLSPDTTSNKLAQVERGRELILLDKSRDWLHVEALLGSSLARDPAFVLEDDDQGKTVSGWVLDNGAVWPSTPEGDRILFGAAVDSEDEASRRHGRRGAAQDALRLYRRVYDMFPTAPLAGEALYRAADIRWQIEKSDMLSRPSARERDPNLRQGIDEESMKLVMKKFPDSKWAQLAAFHLIDNKLCGDWQGSSKCPDKEADIYEKYVKEHPESPAAPEALYDAASRRAALIEIYKTEDQLKKSEQSKSLAIALAQQLISKYPQSDWSSRGETLLFMVQQGVPTYGNAIQ